MSDNFFSLTIILVLILFLVVMTVLVLSVEECATYMFPNDAIVSKHTVTWLDDGITHVSDIEEFCVETE